MHAIYTIARRPGLRWTGVRAVALLLLASSAAAAAAESIPRCPNPPSIRGGGAWPIRRQWTPEEVRHYARWVENIFDKKTQGTVEQRTAKIERILTDPEMNLLEHPDFRGAGSNPQLPRSVIRLAHNVMDCGKFTVFLPSYYAYRRALPWMVTYVRSGGGDVRTAPANIPAGNANSHTTSSVEAFFRNTLQGFSSGNYRVELHGPNSEQSDTLPVAIDPDHLLPGCVNYIDGHCLLLGKVTPYGELRFLNASTTTTRDIFTYNGMNAVVGAPVDSESRLNQWEGCYQGLRVFRYPVAETDSSGRVIRVRRRTDEEMKAFGFSIEQYTRLEEMVTQRFIQEGDLRPESFHDFIRIRLKTVDSLAPLPYMDEYADEIVQVYALREDFVQDAWRDVQKNGPIVYPAERPDENIFQAFGRWETWSSPSSDVDRRNKYIYLADWVDYAVRWFGMMPEATDLTGLEAYDIRSQADLAKALLAEKERIFEERGIEYAKSNGDKVRLTLSEIERRLYDLSFDPNHPPELRWGAPIGSEERASAPQTYTPVPDGTRVPMEEAYRLQAFYRSVSQRETEMSFLLGMFTEGYPVRPKFDRQVAKWFYREEPTEAISEWLVATGRAEPEGPAEPEEPPYILVPRDPDAILADTSASASRQAESAL